MKLTVARHGETDYNALGRFTGSADIPLNAVGLKQAYELARRLESVEFDVIVSSSLARARRTAEAVNEGRGVPMAVMGEFDESRIGVLEGLTRAEAMERHPESWARLIANAPDDAPEGGETNRQADARVARGIARLRAEYGGKRVLVVCHGYTARLIHRQANGLSFEAMQSFTLKNCEVAEYEL